MVLMQAATLAMGAIMSGYIFQEFVGDYTRRTQRNLDVVNEINKLQKSARTVAKTSNAGVLLDNEAMLLARKLLATDNGGKSDNKNAEPTY